MDGSYINFEKRASQTPSAIVKQAVEEWPFSLQPCSTQGDLQVLLSLQVLPERLEREQFHNFLMIYLFFFSVLALGEAQWRSPRGQLLYAPQQPGKPKIVSTEVPHMSNFTVFEKNTI